jgi:short subunit dehydrogenase-like uncharacterized protein
MAAGTRAVVTTVGPYVRYGLPLVAACAEAGTHYADLTGEVLFMHATAQAYDEVARRTGARIVHGAGFDSIPSDLGVLLLHDAVTRAGAGELTDTTLAVTGMRGGASGGTIDSMRQQMVELAHDPSRRRVVFDPYALSPARGEEPDLGPQRDLQGVRRDARLGQWVAPFVMAMVNTRVVRRSNALQDWAYGRRFRYAEVMACGDGALGAARATAVTAGLGAFAAGMAFGPTRSLLDRVLPQPGEGPSEQTRARGFFRMEVHTTTTRGDRYVARVAAKGDPGYAATSVMLGESALALAFDEPALPARAGVLTPATGLGLRVVERLRDAGFTWEANRLWSG